MALCEAKLLLSKFLRLANLSAHAQQGFVEDQPNQCTLHDILAGNQYLPLGTCLGHCLH